MHSTLRQKKIPQLDLAPLLLDWESFAWNTKLVFHNIEKRYIGGWKLPLLKSHDKRSKWELKGEQPRKAGLKTSLVFKKEKNLIGANDTWLTTYVCQMLQHMLSHKQLM